LSNPRECCGDNRQKKKKKRERPFTASGRGLIDV
jgi:hypothetical protein